MKAASHLQALAAIYSLHEEWSCRWAFACRRGCAVCCTRSVTMTGLEGRFVLRWLADRDHLALLAGIPAPAGPRLTTNQFAASCLAGRETPEEAPWNLDPCPFLAGDQCSIYPARPFGCRAFGSLASCRDGGAAEVPPLLVTVNTVLMQIIEHLDQGGVWGNLLAVLRALAAGKETEEKKEGLLKASPCPGFMVPFEEQEEVQAFLDRLLQQPVGDQSLGELLERA